MSIQHIYYFSGTGNCLQVARDLGERLDARVIDLACMDWDQEIVADSVGFVFPVYYAGLPGILERFFRDVNIQGNPYLYGVAVYGGSPGNALLQLERELAGRDKTLCAGFSVKMPGNYILLYGARSRRKQRDCFTRERPAVREIAQAVQTRRKRAVHVNPVASLFSKLLHKKVAKLSQKDRGFHVDDTCDGCRLCAKRCPVRNIDMVDGRPTWRHKCECCMACIQRCPRHAIQYKNKTRRRKRYVNPNV